MRFAFVLVLCLSCGAAALAEPTQDEAALQKEQEKLAGTWEGYAVEGRGENPDRGPVHLRLKIDGNKMSAVDLAGGEKDMGTGTYKLDLAGSGKEGSARQIDATGIVLPGKRERTYQGIYELDGDTLKWCVDNRQKERPTEFRTGSGHYLLILKRKK